MINYPAIIGEVVPFPNPRLGLAKMQRLQVLENTETGNRIVDKVVLMTAQPQGNNTVIRRYYEVGRLLREAIYGQVNLAYLLRVHENGGSLSRAIPPTLCAIKIYGKVKIEEQITRSQENPISEMGAMQFIGQHPNVMTPIECCQDESYIYMVMEFCNGGEIYELIEERQHISEDLARDFTRQILHGLMHLHSRNLAHRDLSLENVLLHRLPRGENEEQQYICKIIDFGMSVRLLADGDGQALPIIPRGVCGKKNYMAPEVVACSSSSAPLNPLLADVWSLGVMIFIMLTGCPPVESATPLDRRYVMIARGQLHDMLRQWGVHLSDPAVDLLRSVLRAAPEERLSPAQILAHPWMMSPCLSPASSPAISTSTSTDTTVTTGESSTRSAAGQALLACEL